MNLSKFENVKMQVNPEQSERVQRAVFAAGGVWPSQKSEKTVQYISCPYLFCGVRLGLLYDDESDDGEGYFNNHQAREVDPDKYAADLEAYVGQAKAE
ncbi:hypothetical protein ACS8E2_05505 [Psychrobacter glaciei]|uniref:hypothetical protein n=1 Tax=Psychrobacter glaciei TaxID=619771 RepID=UPI003F45F479